MNQCFSAAGFCFALLATALIAPDAFTAEVPALDPSLPGADASGLYAVPQPNHSRDDGRRTLKRLPINLGRAWVGVFSKDTVAPLVLGTVATGAAAALDSDARNAIADPEAGFGKLFETIGGPIVANAIVLGFFAAGRAAEPGSRFRSMSYDFVDAAGVTFVYTGLLKTVVRAERPNGGAWSFPSGHTSYAFTLATVSERHCGWKAGVPAYLAAVAMAVARVQRDKHWLSDTVAGATVGIIVGRTVVRLNNRALPNGVDPRHAVTVAPLIGRNRLGVSVAIAF